MNACLSLIIPINYWTILSSIAITGGLYFFVSGFRLLSRKRLLQSTPMSRIHSAALGLVEVNGKAVGPHTMTAPITGNPCFLYRATAWQQRERKTQEWDKIADETLHLPFFIEDATGQLLIEPLAADLDLLRDFREEYAASFLSNALDLPPRVNQFLSRHGVVPTRNIRIEEHLIKPDDPLFIAGTLTENPGVKLRPPAFSENSGPRNGQPQAASNHLHLAPPINVPQPSSEPQVIRLAAGASASSSQHMGQQAKIAAALTRAGITKPEAWSVAGVPFQTVTEANAQAEMASYYSGAQLQEVRVHENDSRDGQCISRFDLTPPVVLMKGANNPLFVISYRSQKEFVGSLAWKSTAMVWGGAAITLLGIYALLAKTTLF